MTQIKVNTGTWDGGTGSTPPTGEGVVRSDFDYDLMGRQTRQRDYLDGYTGPIFSRDVVYNDKSQVVTDDSSTQRGSDIVGSSATFTYGAFGEVQSVVTENLLNGQGRPTTQLTYNYLRPGGAAQSQTIFLPDITAPGTQQVSNFAYQSVGGQDQLQAVSITDGRPRTVTFQTDIAGEVIRRDEQDGDFGAGDPHEMWYRFGGRTMGYLGNNRSLETDHMTSLNMRVETPGAGGAFRNGQAAGGAVADFDQGLAPLNSYGQGSARGSYTVRAGDTLAGIAASLWGDASLWWKLAEANGLSGASALMDGQRLTIPAGVIKNTYTAATFAPYDPAAALGDTAPTNPAAPVNPKPGKNGCGVVGTIILLVVAAVVTYFTAGAASGFFATAFGGSAATATGVIAGTATLAGASAGTIAGVVVGSAVGAAAGSIVSQFAGMMMGIQEKFSWNAVATAAIGSLAGSAFGAAFGGGMVSSALGNAATQVLSPGPNKFSWASVAAAALGSKIPNGMGPAGIGTITARTLVDATSQSVIEGTDFDLALRNALPRVIGQTIGQAIAGEIVGGLARRGSSAKSGPVEPANTPPAAEGETAKSYVAKHRGELAKGLDAKRSARGGAKLEGDIGASGGGGWGDLDVPGFRSFDSTTASETTATDLADYILNGDALHSDASGWFSESYAERFFSPQAPFESILNSVDMLVAKATDYQLERMAPLWDPASTDPLTSIVADEIRTEIAVRYTAAERATVAQNEAFAMAYMGIVGAAFLPELIAGAASGSVISGVGAYSTFEHATGGIRGLFNGGSNYTGLIGGGINNLTGTRAGTYVGYAADAVTLGAGVVGFGRAPFVAGKASGVGAGDGAAAIHPGRLAAEGASVAPESVVRALRQAGTPESLATAKLISTGRLDMRMMTADPSGRGLGGLYRFGTREIELYSNAFSTPRQAAGFATHETTHFMQKLTPRNYNLGHEFDAFRAQGRVDLGHWTNGLSDHGLYNTLQTHPVYRGVPADPRWPR